MEEIHETETITECGSDIMNTSWVMGDGDPLDNVLRDMALSDIGVPLDVQSYVRSEWLSAWQRDTSWLQRHFCKVIDGRGAADDGRDEARCDEDERRALARARCLLFFDFSVSSSVTTHETRHAPFLS